MSPRTPARLAILASGSGTNLQAIFDYFDTLDEPRPAEVVLVASNRRDAYALERSRSRGVATAVIERPGDGEALSAMLDRHGATLVALAGYLKLVPREVTRRWRGAIVNVHPALLPKFGGPGMFGHHVHEAVLAAGDSESGPTVHFVDDEYDGGGAIARLRVPVEPADTAGSLAARVLAAEHLLYPRALHALSAGLVTLGPDGKCVIGDPAAFAAELPPPPAPYTIEFESIPPFALRSVPCPAPSSPFPTSRASPISPPPSTHSAGS